jgi:hypothetical protein
MRVPTARCESYQLIGPGLHQRSISAVKIWNAVSGSTPTSTEAVIASAVLKCISFRRPIDVLFKRIKLTSPERLYLREPIPEGHERLRPQAVDTYASIPLASLLGDQTAYPEDPQMFAHCRAAHARCRGQLPRGAGTFDQQIHDVPARRFSQRIKSVIQLINHVGNYCLMSYGKASQVFDNNGRAEEE